MTRRRKAWLALPVALVLVASGCGRSSSKSSGTTGGGGTTATTSSGACSKEPLQATDVGVTATDITVEVLADVGSPLAPGLFQGNFDAMNAFATYVNAHGGIGCRKLIVKQWDTKLSPTESKNGLIDACKNAFALVGNNALFNPDVSPMTGCVDKTGAATGLPDISALANDINEQCASTHYSVQGISEHCPITTGQPRTLTAMQGVTKYYLQHNPGGLHGVYLVPGDLPTTVQSATYLIAAQVQAGVSFDATPKVSGADAQPAYTPRIQVLKAKGGNYVYDGSNDIAFIRMRKEAVAQGVDSVKLWACSLACYTKAYVAQGGSTVDGTFTWMQYLPFEEASLNPEEQAYISSVGADKVDSFGAQAWQAAGAFRQVVNDIVAKSGPNAITRTALLAGLKGLTAFTDNGWMGEKDLRGFSPCYVILQLQAGKWVRISPTKPGTFDCTPSNLTTVTLDPAAEAAKIK